MRWPSFSQTSGIWWNVCILYTTSSMYYHQVQSKFFIKMKSHRKNMQVIREESASRNDPEQSEPCIHRICLKIHPSQHINQCHQHKSTTLIPPMEEEHQFPSYLWVFHTVDGSEILHHLRCLRWGLFVFSGLCGSSELSTVSLLKLP